MATIAIRTSKAIHVWLAVLILVISLLAFRTSEAQSNRYNLVVVANTIANGASVLVDQRVVGTLAKSQLSGLDCPVFWDNLADGKHEIEVIKPGFRPFKKRFEMATETFISVDLMQNQE